MSYEERKGSSSFLHLVAVAAALLIMKFTVDRVRQYTTPAVLGAERAAEREAARNEVEAAAARLMTSYGWVDKDRQVVHVPVDRGVELMLSEWQNPGEGRKKLLSLSARATVELEAPPATPSVYE